MLTLLSSPKSFTGYTGKIQRNAIRSWLAIHPDVDVIIYGDGEGVAEACHEMGVDHVPDTPCSSSGVPYFNGIVEHAAKYGKYDLQVYLNCDILLSGILATIELIKFPKFLLIGQRIDLDESVFVDTTSPDFKNKLNKLAKEGRISLHGPTGIDYFAFKRGLWHGLPPVIIGRAGYDNALLAYCMTNRVPIIDGTFGVIALHQFHDYGHVSGGKATVMAGKDALQNYRAAGGRHSALLVSDAAYTLAQDGMHYNPCHGDRLRQFELKCRFVLGYPNLGLVIRLLWRMLAMLDLVGEKRALDIVQLFQTYGSSERWKYRL